MTFNLTFLAYNYFVGFVFIADITTITDTVYIYFIILYTVQPIHKISIQNATNFFFV